MSQINLTNWEIVDDVQNGKVIIRSKVTGNELELSESADLNTSTGIDADTVGGQAPSVFVTSRYKDSEARSAVSGSSIDGSNFAGVGTIKEVSTFGNLPAIDPPQLAFVTDEDEYYHSNLTGGSFNISSASFSKSINTQDTNPTGMAFNNDGTRLYEVSPESDRIFEFRL